MLNGIAVFLLLVAVKSFVKINCGLGKSEEHYGVAA